MKFGLLVTFGSDEAVKDTNDDSGNNRKNNSSMRHLYSIDYVIVFQAFYTDQYIGCSTTHARQSDTVLIFKFRKFIVKIQCLKLPEAKELSVS